MGFCSKNPANPTGSSVLAGSAPDYSTCSWTYENSSGEAASFAAGGTVDLSEAYSSDPDVGTYPYAVMMIAKDFLIKGKYGPVGGKTFYSTNKYIFDSDKKMWVTDFNPENYKRPIKLSYDLIDSKNNNF